MAKISILVPIYNVEKYLKECLESIVNQTLTDIEIICINDGSTDNSLKILEEFANKDNRIKIINKPNSGYGASMNLGLKNTTGEYIGIVESDDFVKNNMFEDLYKLAVENDADIVKSDYYFYTTSNNQIRRAGKIPSKITNAAEFPKLLGFQPSIWSSIYKREFLMHNNVNFLETPGASYQDTSFAFKAMALAKKVVLTDNAYLHYRVDNENSSVNSKDKVFFVCNEYDEITTFLNNNPEISSFANTQKLINQYVTYTWNLGRINPKFREEFIEVFSNTFTEYYNSGKIKKEFFSKVNKKEFLMLIRDKKSFLSHIEKRLNALEGKTERRKKFSIRINSSRISIVLFGKQILEI